MLSFPEVNELSEEVRRVFDEMDRAHASSCRGVSGVCTPAIDVVETDGSIEVLVDLPGVSVDSVRLLFKHGALVIAGEKVAADPCADGGVFHLVERGCGRFARVVRFPGAVDPSRARASLDAGELRVSLPRIAERRGRDIVIPVREPDDVPARDPGTAHTSPS